MNFKTNLFAILAIFCVILSACAVSATDNVDYGVDDAQGVSDDAVSSDVDDTQSQNGTDEDQDIHDDMVLPPDYAHNEEAMLNATNSTNSTNSTNTTNATNATSPAAGENATNPIMAHIMHATGNPIFILVVVAAVLGGAFAISRKK